ncbi:peptide MFS transporter [Salinimicrobium sp. CAU 1759]
MAATVPAEENDFFKSKVLGHPAGLFVLFFTEMWERFSFYGMRVLLINFLTMAVVGVDNPGWGWSAENAGALFGTYAGLLYLTPIAGGIIADKITGYRWAVVIGAAIMTLGHASMALETEFSLYFGLALLVIGTGFFKPNITSIISEMYDGKPDKKDGAYTIFYMGVNAGAFFGMMLCGYLAERVGWSWGFGLAGIFMFLGTLQFWLAKPLFGNIGGVPDKAKLAEEKAREEATGVKDHSHNPFTLFDKILVVATSVIGLLYLINDPSSKIGNLNLLPAVMPFDFQGEPFSGPLAFALIGLVLFLILVISRIARYTKIVRDRLIAVIIFAFFTVFFWMSFEQGATSLIIFARDSVDRMLVGTGATVFNVFNTLLTVVPLMIITWVLYLLWKQTYKRVLGSNIVLVVCFGIIWAIVIWMLVREFQGNATEITVSWFSILNSFFIIVFASFFSKWWESKYNPSAAWKYSFGLILLGVGFGLLAFGSSGVAEGAKVSMIWLILAYLFHTLGELCLSPLGLSYVSKLVPARMIAFMFGMWYLAIAIGNKLAGSFGGMIDEITEQYSLSTFFLIFTVIPIGAGVLVALLNPLLKKLMHGVK